MFRIKNISIPKPCHESWQQMTPAAQGRHCAQCCKTVTDFTGMTNNQIVNYLATANNVCGRFDKQQLGSLNHVLYTDDLPATGGWKRLALALSLITSTLSFKAIAQTQPVNVEQGPQVKLTEADVLLGKIYMQDSARSRTITGCVRDENNEPLPGVTIKLPSATFGTQTDMKGNFTLTVPASATKFQVLFIGFKSMLVDICADKNYPIKLTSEQYALLGEIVVTRTPFIKRVYYKCIKRPIRKIFN
jgi:hypothetical protein